ncbi:hypothetical protein [Georgenia sp. SYP-B2076]|uniref:hypothetical protein n=1 Tax=Georgenia sp. SYP-B2076 TaxID=2495881 RepID=UPI000F8ECA1C|nr:hypothetical protein [Georgenia sp. SYP-B2076]
MADESRERASVPGSWSRRKVLDGDDEGAWTLRLVEEERPHLSAQGRADAAGDVALDRRVGGQGRAVGRVGRGAAHALTMTAAAGLVPATWG